MNQRGHVGDPRSAGEPTPGPPRVRAERLGGSLLYLLDHDSELADGLDASMRLAARRLATAIVFEADPGEMALHRRLAEIGSGPGILVLKGVLAVNVTVGGRIASELVGSGDLLESDTSDQDELFTCSTGWRCLTTGRFAVLDSGFAERVGQWPQLTQVLLARAERRTHSLNVQRAIASQPRLEIRLALLLLHLASRWGRVEPGGVALTLPLTHQLLGRLGDCTVRDSSPGPATSGICTRASTRPSTRCSTTSPPGWHRRRGAWGTGCTTGRHRRRSAGCAPSSE
jgi:hypothetical protein